MAASAKPIVPLVPDIYASECPTRGVLTHVTSQWGVLILVALAKETHRFSELRRRVGGVSEKMLAQTLRALEEDGFVDRKVYPEVPPRVEYRLTQLGREVTERLATLVVWIEQNIPRIQKARAAKQR